MKLLRPDTAGGRELPVRQLAGDDEEVLACRSGTLERFVCVPPNATVLQHRPLRGGMQRVVEGLRQRRIGDRSVQRHARLCFDSGNGNAEARRYQFCSVTGTAQGGTCSDTRSQVFGWCCGIGSSCGKDFGECKCAGPVCPDGHCCPKHHYCDGPLCKKYCDANDTVERCGDDCCGPGRTCSGVPFFTCECQSPLVECGSDCCNPKDTPDQPNWLQRQINNWLGMAQQSSAAHGGGHRRTARAAPEVGATNALLVLATTSGQRGAAREAFVDGHRDANFVSTVKVAKVSLPAITADATLDAGSAKALTALTAAQAKASAQIMAGAIALARTRGAMAKHNRAAARRQLLASAKFAEAAAKTLKSETTLRAKAAAALKAGKVEEVNITPDAVAAFVKSVRSSGVPSSLRSLLADVGIKGHDLGRVRAGLLQKDVDPIYAAGPALIAPLSDATDRHDHSQLIADLHAYARSSRRHRIAKGHQPRLLMLRAWPSPVLRDPGRVPRVAGRTPRRPRRADRRLPQAQDRAPEHDVAAVGARGAVLRVDRRRASQHRR